MFGFRSQHTTEHGDIHCRLFVQQGIQFLVAGRTLFLRQGCHQGVQRRALFGGDMYQLFDFQRVVFLHRAVDLGNLAGPLGGLFLADTRLDQRLEGLAPQALGAGTNGASQLLLEQFRGAPGALEALRGHPQALNATQTCGFRVAQIVSVEVGRRVGNQQMQLNEAGHRVGSLLDSGSSAAARSRALR
ncbi:hypothetical protein D3C77_525860 [compost metagenome]